MLGTTFGQRNWKKRYCDMHHWLLAGNQKVIIEIEQKKKLRQNSNSHLNFSVLRICHEKKSLTLFFFNSQGCSLNIRCLHILTRSISYKRLSSFRALLWYNITFALSSPYPTLSQTSKYRSNSMSFLIKFLYY